MLAGKNIAIIGLGLMGGALAMGLRRQEPAMIGAYDLDGEVLESALEKGVIDRGENDPAGAADLLGMADLVIFCLYPRQTVAFFDAHMADITGVKGILVDRVLPNLREDLDFIMGHPMAGSEKEGFGGATADIFVDHNYILVPTPQNKPENIAWLKTIIRGLGFNNIVETTPEGHDSKIAFTSQLCHVIACALIDCKEDRHISDFEGGSFCDLTRIAMINAPMWSELFVTNQEALLEQIDSFEQSLKAMRQLIEASDETGLQTMMQSVRTKRVIMEVDRQNKTQKNRHASKDLIAP